jgi:hypothetical protein
MSLAVSTAVASLQPPKTPKPRAPVPRVAALRPDRSVADIADAIARSQNRLRQAIAEAAYYRAQQRGFAPGHELEDWLAAQHQIIGD